MTMMRSTQGNQVLEKLWDQVADAGYITQGRRAAGETDNATVAVSIGSLDEEVSGHAC